MNSQHLSDEAVAAFADGVLRGHPRERATKHVDQCAECRGAVRAQREAAWALRTAPAPSLPTGLFERLQALPAVTPISPLPTVVTDDGTTMLSTFTSSFVAAAAVVPTGKRSRRTATPHDDPSDGDDKGGSSRGRGLVTGAAVVALTAGALVASSAVRDDTTPGTPTVRPAVSRDGVPEHPQLVGLRIRGR